MTETNDEFLTGSADNSTHIDPNPPNKVRFTLWMTDFHLIDI